MKINNKILLYIILFIVLSLQAYANSNWWEYSNSDYRSSGGNSFIGFGSNFPLITQNITSYIKCNLPSSLYTPVISDLDLDTQNEIVLSDSKHLYIYSPRCELENTISLSTNLKSMPEIVNFDGDASPEIIIMQNHTINTYEYSNGAYSEIDSLVYDSSFPIMSNSDAMTCFNIPFPTCIIFQAGIKDVLYIEPEPEDTFFSLIDSTISLNPSQLQANFAPPVNYGGISNAWVGGDVYYAVVGGQFGNGGTGLTNFNLLDETSDSIVSFSSPVNYGHVINGFAQQDIFLAKVGGVFRILASEKPTSTVGSPKYCWFMKDLSGNNIVYNDRCTDSVADFGLSNFMVADYNKDGLNDACIFYKNNSVAGDYNSFLRCFDSLGVETINYDIRNSINLSVDALQGAVMGDFVPNISAMSFATVEGIYYINNTGDLIKWYDTGIDYDSARDGKLITAFGNTNPDNMIVYTDSSGGFILYTEQFGICGDQICDTLENSITCPADCGANATGLVNETGDSCKSDLDCQYGICEYNFCTLAGQNHFCDSNLDCISGVCSNNKCTKPSYWDSISASKDQQFGDDANTNNFISLFLAIGVSGIIIYAGGAGLVSVGAGALVFTGLCIFFAVVGWLSAFLLVGIIIVELLLVVVGFMIGGSSD